MGDRAGEADILQPAVTSPFSPLAVVENQKGMDPSSTSNIVPVPPNSAPRILEQCKENLKRGKPPTLFLHLEDPFTNQAMSSGSHTVSQAEDEHNPCSHSTSWTDRELEKGKEILALRTKVHELKNTAEDQKEEISRNKKDILSCQKDLQSTSLECSESRKKTSELESRLLDKSNELSRVYQELQFSKFRDNKLDRIKNALSIALVDSNMLPGI
ncbi:hypothetical protein C5167_030504 [Papaver somniferum]|nr:hypothetical protein C5167_030504 [Papaver somniferum]